MKEKPYWTPDEFLASGECPYGRSVLYRLLKEGKIPALRQSRVFVIPKSAWRRFLDSCGTTATPAPFKSVWADGDRGAFLDGR